ncbi:MAG: hypothetical protein ACI9UJ_000784, partial [bacterium]
ENNFAPAFNHLKNYGRFDNNINFHNRLINKRSFFYPLEWEFWRFYFLLTLALSVLLIILCSVNIAEFGWGMLVVALHPTVFGIVGALVAFMFQDVSGEKAAVIGIVLLLLFTLNAYIIAFFKGFKPSLRRAFAIACHIYTPIAAAILLFLLKEASNCCFIDNNWREYCDCYLPCTSDEFDLIVLSVVVFGAIVSTFFFGRYYKKQYTNPQIK